MFEIRTKRTFLVMIGLMASPLVTRADTAYTPDSGKFLMTVQEKPLATTTFKMDAKGNATMEANVEAQGKKINLKIDFKATKGKITEVTADAGPQGKYALTVNGQASKILLTAPGMAGTPKTVTLPAQFLPFSNTGTPFLTYLLKAYDARKGGEQAFETRFVDGVGQDGNLPAIQVTLSRLGAKPVTLKGKKVSLTRYSLAFAGPTGNLGSEIMAMSDGRILRWEVPAQKLVVVRDGYQALNKAK